MRRMFAFWSSTSPVSVPASMRLWGLWTATARIFLARSCPTTYWSSTVLISAGLGRLRISLLFSSSHSSAMMSLQSSMHSSQMYTVGPAMSLRTSFWLLPQNEHFSAPPPSRDRAATRRLLTPGCRHHGGFGHRPRGRLGGDDLVHDLVFPGLLRRHEEVAVRVALDLLHALPGVVDQDAVELLPHPEDLLGLDVDVRGLALHAAEGLMDHDACVGQGEALPLGAGAQQQRAHGGGLAHADGGDGRLHVLHGVIDGHARRHRPAGRVDVERDVLVRVLGLEEEHLGDDEVGDLVLDVRREEDDPLLEQTGKDVEGPLAAGRLLHHHWNQTHWTPPGCHAASVP